MISYKRIFEAAAVNNDKWLEEDEIPEHVMKS